jgi:two-component system, NtrC family, response regulator AtoC
MDKSRVLVVDDEKLIAWSLRIMLEKAGYAAATAGSGEEAIRQLNQFNPQLVLLDLCLPDTSGLELLRRMRELREDLAVIMITANANADHAVNAFRMGADDFFGKPFNLEEVQYVVAKVFERLRQNMEVDICRRERRKRAEHDQLVGNSPQMVSVFKMINVCARSDAKTVLITGESGTGKELVAHAIHLHSARAERPFIEVNCAAIPENLLENELFGHEKGAYTDASRRQKGIFELAEGGTVFLDEIGDMPYAMQAKLLKVMETKRFRRLGGEEDVETNVRIVTATNQELPRLVEEGKFRSDLFFRLNVVNIRIAPLRERRGDIPSLIAYFIRCLNEEYGRSVAGVAQDALGCLENYDWPGNVRELRNTIERAMMLEPGKVLGVCHLTEEVVQSRRHPADEPVAVDMSATDCSGTVAIRFPADGLSMEEVERQLIIFALKRAGGNQSQAARCLKMSRDTLRYRMKKFNVSDTVIPGPTAASCGTATPRWLTC